MIKLKDLLNEDRTASIVQQAEREIQQIRDKYPAGTNKTSMDYKDETAIDELENKIAYAQSKQESVNEDVSPKGWNMSKKYIKILAREVKNLQKYHRVQNESDFLEVASYMQLQLKYMLKDLNESVNEQIPRYFRGYVSNVNDNTDRLEKNVKQMIVDLGKDGLKKESLQLASLFKKHIIEFKVKFQNMAKQLVK